MRHEDELLGNTLDDSSLSLRLIAGAEIAAARIWIDNWHRMLSSIECMTVDPLETETAENSFDFVIDAVGAKATRPLAIGAVKLGGVVMHIGLQDWASEIDMRKLTLSEITLLGTYTYSMADMHATVAALYGGAFGMLAWVDTQKLEEGGAAFDQLHKGLTALSKAVLIPGED